jgi:hypothetical protein
MKAIFLVVIVALTIPVILILLESSSYIEGAKSKKRSAKKPSKSVKKPIPIKAISPVKAPAPINTGTAATLALAEAKKVADAKAKAKAEADAKAKAKADADAKAKAKAEADAKAKAKAEADAKAKAKADADAKAKAKAEADAKSKAKADADAKAKAKADADAKAKAKADADAKAKAKADADAKAEASRVSTANQKGAESKTAQNTYKNSKSSMTADTWRLKANAYATASGVTSNSSLQRDSASQQGLAQQAVQDEAIEATNVNNAQALGALSKEASIIFNNSNTFTNANDWISKATAYKVAAYKTRAASIKSDSDNQIALSKTAVDNTATQDGTINDLGIVYGKPQMRQTNITKSPTVKFEFSPGIFIEPSNSDASASKQCEYSDAYDTSQNPYAYKYTNLTQKGDYETAKVQLQKQQDANTIQTANTDNGIKCANDPDITGEAQTKANSLGWTSIIDQIKTSYLDPANESLYSAQTLLNSDITNPNYITDLKSKLSGLDYVVDKYTDAIYQAYPDQAPVDMPEEQPDYSQQPDYYESPDYSQQPDYYESPDYSQQPDYYESPDYSQQPDYYQQRDYSQEYSDASMEYVGE